jgi:FtsP/CotA-like multicopper oxidase with cupredoxin domain
LIRTATAVRALLSAVGVGALLLAATTASAQEGLPVARINDHRQPAGVLRDGALSLDLEARETSWYPEGDDGPAVRVQAFGVPGESPSVPGPMIRVPEGTEVTVSIANRLPGDTLVVHGLQARPAPDGAPLVVLPGETADARFTAGEPGTYFYWATTTGLPMGYRFHDDAQLGGAIVVDPPGVIPDDRVFLISWWFGMPDSTTSEAEEAFGAMVINGKSWPHTERLRHAVGDTVRWRWINVTDAPHPMHLHGFYFRIERRGTQEADSALAVPLDVVTERLSSGHTFASTWVPDRPGNWLMHCHFVYHIDGGLRIAPPPEGEHDPAHRMAGLVMGMHVDPSGNVADLPPPTRHIHLAVEPVSPKWAGVTFAYALENGPPSIPGPPIVLHRDEPTAITVVNHLAEATSVHWHGIELVSYADGVPDWSGSPGHIATTIAPGDSFTAEYVAPRSGTFIYHSHFSEVRQIDGGLYGALLVVDPGASIDPEVDRVLVVSYAGSTSFSEVGPALLNGVPIGEAPPIEVPAGRSVRLRLINIMGEGIFNASIRQGEATGHWRPLAKDGGDLPLGDEVAQHIRMASGETADFGFTGTPGTDPRLFFDLGDDETFEVPIRVR